MSHMLRDRRTPWRRADVPSGYGPADRDRPRATPGRNGRLDDGPRQRSRRARRSVPTRRCSTLSTCSTLRPRSHAWAPPARMSVLHIGGAACTFPRYLAHAYPESRHLVIEIDPDLARLAREWGDLPRAPRLRIRVGDGAEVLRSRPDASADVVVRDAFAGDTTPPHLADDAWWKEVRRVVRPGGLAVANVAAAPRSDAGKDDARSAQDGPSRRCAPSESPPRSRERASATSRSSRATPSTSTRCAATRRRRPSRPSSAPPGGCDPVSLARGTTTSPEMRQGPPPLRGTALATFAKLDRTRHEVGGVV